MFNLIWPNGCKHKMAREVISTIESSIPFISGMNNIITDDELDKNKDRSSFEKLIKEKALNEFGYHFPKYIPCHPYSSIKINISHNNGL